MCFAFNPEYQIRSQEIQYLLRIYYVPGTVLVTLDIPSHF